MQQSSVLCTSVYTGIAYNLSMYLSLLESFTSKRNRDPSSLHLLSICRSTPLYNVSISLCRSTHIGKHGKVCSCLWRKAKVCLAFRAAADILDIGRGVLRLSSFCLDEGISSFFLSLQTKVSCVFRCQEKDMLSFSHSSLDLSSYYTSSMDLWVWGECMFMSTCIIRHSLGKGVKFTSLYKQAHSLPPSIFSGACCCCCMHSFMHRH